MFRRSLAIWAAAAVLLAGCTSHGDPAAPPTPSVSSTASTPSSPTASPARTGPLTTGPGVRPGESPPVEGDLARQHAAAGAVAFAYYFFRAVDWSLATSDPSLLRPISLRSCAACNDHIESIAELESGGGHIRGGRTNAQSAAIVTGSFRVQADFAIKVLVTQDQIAIVQADGSATTLAPARSPATLLFVSWVNGRWMAVEQGDA